MSVMASNASSDGPNDACLTKGAALQHSPWRTMRVLSRVLVRFERFLAESGFDRAPWLVVAFGAGLAAWFALASQNSWAILIGLSFAFSVVAFVLTFRSDKFPI